MSFQNIYKCIMCNGIMLYPIFVVLFFTDYTIKFLISVLFYCLIFNSSTALCYEKVPYFLTNLPFHGTLVVNVLGGRVVCFFFSYQTLLNTVC